VYTISNVVTELVDMRLSIDEAFSYLQHSRSIAAKCYEISGNRVRMNVDCLAKEAQRRFGRLQRVDKSVPEPTTALRYVAASVPGAVAAINTYYMEKRGELNNEIMILEGPGGVGKSSFAFWLAEIYGGEVLTSEDEIVESIRRLFSENKWIPVLVLDDVAAIVSKYWFMDREEKRWSHFFKLIEYMKDISGMVLVTARSFDGVARRLRELSGLQGTMKRVVYAKSYIFDIIEWKRPGKKTVEYVDVLWPGLRMPEHHWNRIMSVRRSRALRLLDKMIEG